MNYWHLKSRTYFSKIVAQLVGSVALQQEGPGFSYVLGVASQASHCPKNVPSEPQ